MDTTRGSNTLIRVFLDPDGTGDVLIAVIVGLLSRAALGVMVMPKEGRIEPGVLRSVFHVGDTCLHGLEFDPVNHIGALRSALL